MLKNYGFSSGDTLQLIDRYTDYELSWFIENIIKDFNNHDIIKSLDFTSELIMVHNAITSKKGNASYSRWRKEKVEGMQELYKTETVFDKLHKQPDTKTVFSRLKYFSKGNK